ncbi:hypothetical protein BU16DRAFT_461264 [Lophium mytilinum]|uniref:Uncharacterized protein n=1 Tax=Lophium mytilinum TaxID=390894 RepID=A0A6A6QWY5_9PEZI|nr:hypothetical protein BU16DRAFT_461264 [Lophium mytilinum]
MKREVPQEHSHNAQVASVNTNLKLNNPDNIQDAIFGLLGNAAGAAGQGDITDTDCLQQATADQAFTNAKAAGDVQGMTDALIYRGLERNTGSVGLASVLCTSVKAVNPEIAAISQHQDPASTGAAATNKAITLEIAKQIASIGGNAQDALKAGTFAPGQIGDPTAAGHTCDTADDTAGCIFSQNLLVEDATADEITAAVAGIAAGGAAPAAAGNSTTACPATTATNQTTPATTASAVPAASSTPAATAGTSNLDLGSCSNPTIVFGPGFDGRKEDSFEPADTATFTHGSALNIKVISDFICQQLDTKCKAGQDALDACTKAQTAAAAATGQAAADAFNAALGFGAAKMKRAPRAPTMGQARRLLV